ncbi:MAG: nitroreductase family protein [Alphaproteobacteria bacterium]|nr:nitroreductase family protein [Alphaproteobacteria bacterium]MBU1515259.1 nitroreductase family protein [Alphaproteobacteria bacterium]MBU2092389.1 nitroreductase family protein [Alphaproteobacteria bacterium]MBU2152983.1 nitroreductase family protein [Alphaproteobacteria bacterium]MBU2305814.1 nitroreductase family protein [Alphaproteobacteria bacterium]
MAGPGANGRAADHDIHPMFLNRWSPRAFTGEAMPEDLLNGLFEAARWAPSAFNAQPWRFVYAHKGTGDWDRLFDVLIPYNQAWVKHASVLMYVISDRFRRAEGHAPAPIHSHSFDAGAAWAYLALQASHIGWAAHGMAGFDLARSYEALGVPEDQYRVEAAIAVGRPTDAAILDEPYRSREAPSPRNPVSSFAFEGRFKA